MIGSEYSRKEVRWQRLKNAYMNANSFEELSKKCSQAQFPYCKGLITQIHLQYEKKLRFRVTLNLLFAAIGCIYIPLIIFLKWRVDINLQYGFGFLIVVFLVVIYRAIKLRLRFKKNIKTFSELFSHV